jgi:hypothetical protein
MSEELKSGHFERTCLLRIVDTINTFRITGADPTLPERSLAELSSLYPRVAELDFSSSFAVYAVLSQVVEGCHPQLVERWEISYLPVRADLDNFNSTAQVMLRSLMLSCITLPARHKLAGLVFTLYFYKADVPTWSRGVSSRDIQTFPAVPMRFAGPRGTGGVRVEYVAEIPKPQIAKQDIGHRPRLISVDNGDFLELRDSPSSLHPQDRSISTETSAPFPPLSEMKLHKPDSPKAALLAVITSDCLEDHQSIGFIPMSHSICNDLSRSSDEDEDEVGSLEFELVVQDYNPFLSDKESMSEDAKVACFRSNCEKAQRLSLFNSKVLQKPKLFTQEASALASQVSCLQALKEKMLSNC